MLVFDDAQHGSDSIAFAEHLSRLVPARAEDGAKLGGCEVPAVLCVLTVRDEALEDRPIEAAALRELCARPRVRELSIGPLAPRAHARLIEDLLGLEQALAARVAARTAGSPLFAVQLVGDWVQRGCLTSAERGFVLRAGADAEIPDDIHELWSARIDRLIASMPATRREDARRALSIVAVLGREVVREEWEAACSEARVEPPEGLLDAMALLRLCLVGRQRFTLVHGMLHESLERRAREEGSWRELHAACARMLKARPADERAQAERLARHFIEAEELEEALPSLLAAAQARLTTCDFAQARAHCARHRGVLDRLGAPEDDLARARAWILESEILATQALLAQSEALLAKAAPIARAHDARALLGGIARLGGGIRLKRGQLAPAIACFIEGLALMGELGDAHGEAFCLHGLGECEKLAGRLEASEDAYHRACERFEAVGDRLGHGRSRMGLADIHRRRGELDDAVRVLEGANEAMRRIGNRHSVGVGLNALGDIARNRGDIESAERCYEESLEVFGAIASEEASIVRLNVALVLLAKGEPAKARDVFEQTRPELGRAGREGYLSYTVAGLLAAAAGLADWPATERLYAEIALLLGEPGIVDDDIASCLELAGDESARGGNLSLARRAYALAAAQWESLGRPARRDAVRAKSASA